MPSFDVVSEINMQEVDNAINQAQKEILTRFDFKGSKTEIDLDKTKNEIKLLAADEMRLEALRDVLSSKLLKRGIDLNALEFGKSEQGTGMSLRQLIKLKQGLEAPIAKNIVKLIKDSKLKVDASIQEKQVRITGKKIDDLQEAMAILRGKTDELKVPLQYVNMRS